MSLSQNSDSIAFSDCLHLKTNSLIIKSNQKVYKTGDRSSLTGVLV